MWTVSRSWKKLQALLLLVNFFTNKALWKIAWPLKVSIGWTSIAPASISDSRPLRRKFFKFLLMGCCGTDKISVEINQDPLGINCAYFLIFKQVDAVAQLAHSTYFSFPQRIALSCGKTAARRLALGLFVRRISLVIDSSILSKMFIYQFARFLYCT